MIMKQQIVVPTNCRNHITTFLTEKVRIPIAFCNLKVRTFYFKIGHQVQLIQNRAMEQLEGMIFQFHAMSYN